MGIVSVIITTSPIALSADKMNCALGIACLNIHGCVCAYFLAVCSGEITDSAGVVLSPNWPEAYDRGQDCIWGIHVEEDKRIMLDIQVYVSTFDMCTLICLLTHCPLICMKLFPWLL